MADERKSRNLVLSCDIDDRSVAPLIERILEINEDDLVLQNNIKNYSPQPINLFVNTYGGEVHATLALIGAIESSLTPVHTYAIGAAMSAGLWIVVSGDQRFAHRMATFMYHEVADMKIGKLESQKHQIEESQRIMNLMDGYLMERTKIPQSKLRKEAMKDWYFDAKTALEYGVVDYIVAKLPNNSSSVNIDSIIPDSTKKKKRRNT